MACAVRTRGRGLRPGRPAIRRVFQAAGLLDCQLPRQGKPMAPFNVFSQPPGNSMVPYCDADGQPVSLAAAAGQPWLFVSRQPGVGDGNGEQRRPTRQRTRSPHRGSLASAATSGVETRTQCIEDCLDSALSEAREAVQFEDGERRRGGVWAGEWASQDVVALHNALRAGMLPDVFSPCSEFDEDDNIANPSWRALFVNTAGWNLPELDVAGGQCGASRHSVDSTAAASGRRCDEWAL